MKKTISLALAVIMCMTLVIPTFAIGDESGLAEYNETQFEVVMDDNIDNYDCITVYSKSATVFSSTQSADTFEKEDNSIELARAGVLSLNLPDENLAYIEDACLKELDMMELQGYSSLESYSVLIPKNRASESAPAYYGSYGGIKFYSSLTSVKKYVGSIDDDFASVNTNQVASWAKNLVNLALCFADKVNPLVTVSWTMLTADYPAHFVYHEGDYVTHQMGLETQTRTFFVNRGVGYQSVYANEFGYVRAVASYYYPGTTGEPGYMTAYPRSHVDEPSQSDLLKKAYIQYSANSYFSNLLGDQIQWVWKQIKHD